MKILSVEEKTELLCKVMAGLGISANDFMNQFKDDEPEPNPPPIEQVFIDDIIEGDKSWNNHLSFSLKKAVLYLLNQSIDRKS